jgi:hypothetical protein
MIYYSPKIKSFKHYIVIVKFLKINYKSKSIYYCKFDFIKIKTKKNNQKTKKITKKI